MREEPSTRNRFFTLICFLFVIPLMLVGNTVLAAIVGLLGIFNLSILVGRWLYLDSSRRLK